MAAYHVITIGSDGMPTTQLTTRPRRDAAALAFERAVFDVVEALGLKDRWPGHRALQEAGEAYEPDCAEKVVKIGGAAGYQVHFWKG